VLLMAHEIPPLSWMHGWTKSYRLPTRMAGYLFGVGIPEELCKAAVLFFLAQRRVLLPPQSMLFYGLMSGLGFGIYEGVGYQTGANLNTGSMGAYYLNNMLRLTSLPFLHAIWSGIAGYFIGFAFQYPQRKAGLLVVAIALPSLLHGLYDVANHALALVFATLSVLALYLYLAKSVYFESVLAGKPASATPPLGSAAPPKPDSSSPTSKVPPFPPASA
ncbi:MAG TPA: PrsW family glutamic-type intramembrane protease, partial [Candidatus Limnocylindria bacterium]|nr:PrsW family glutamic-type intramembrane protease [Candidatus Limnocylindria bacterium]